ncbi:hypothetical protein QC764_0066550 [Podospora pseudoanserina]|uniref:Uncharacterized protein n=1 Tax=Podospora pseudoanserina TaxID=2609844 RepID=A0ABR0IA11_9PEZI|nr:hypothetical protein QC764_0066550 [Podospora pseudoanserina]
MATSCTTNLALSPDPCNARYIILKPAGEPGKGDEFEVLKGRGADPEAAAVVPEEVFRQGDVLLGLLLVLSVEVKPLVPRAGKRPWFCRPGLDIVVVAVPDLPPDHLDRLGHAPGTVVSRLDKLFRVHQPNLQTRRDPQRAHRTGRSAEQVPFFFVVRSEPYDLPVSENHLHLSDRVVEEAVLEAGGFPCCARESAAGGDAWELHHHRGDQAVGEGSFDQLVHWDVWFHEGGFGCFVDG